MRALVCSHSNSQKRIYLKNYIYFVITITHKRFPYFEEDIFCRLFIDDLLFCQELKKFELYAYTIMPNHVHLLIKLRGEYNISRVMQSIKKEFSRDINYIIAGDIPECRLQGKQYSFRYKKQFYTISLGKYRQGFLQKYVQSPSQFPHFRWQSSFRDRIIRDEKDLYNHLRYIENNYLKHGLEKNELSWSCYSKGG